MLANFNKLNTILSKSNANIQQYNHIHSENILEYCPIPEIILTIVMYIDEEELKRMKHPSRLTVGARAFCKHAHRSSEGFWGIVKGTEAEKNTIAETAAKKIVDESIWINAHILPHSEHIIEVTNDIGVYIRNSVETIKGMA